MSGSLSGGGVNITFDDNKEFPSISQAAKTADWAKESPITSWAPIMGYRSSGAFGLTITIRFSIEEGGVMSRVKQCRSLVLPEGGGYRPPQVTVNIENYIVGFLGVATSVSDVPAPDTSWIGGEPAAVDVTIAMEECSDSPLTSLYGGGG